MPDCEINKEKANNIKASFCLNSTYNLEEKLSEIYNIIFENMFSSDEKLLENNKNE